jgi:excisionase family DNA binding protein
MVYELVRLGKLRSLKIGKRRLIPREAIDEAIAALETRAT